MLKYLNGKIIKEAIPNETTLVIKTVGDNVEQGQMLSSVYSTILKEYAKHITTICFIGGENDQMELIDLVKEAKKHNLKAGVSTYLTEISQINANLLNELTYLQLGKKLYMKDLCPFTDEEEWFELTNQKM